MKNDGFWEAFLYKKKLSYLFIWKINNLSFLLKPSVSEKKKLTPWHVAFRNRRLDEPSNGLGPRWARASSPCLGRGRPIGHQRNPSTRWTSDGRFRRDRKARRSFLCPWCSPEPQSGLRRHSVTCLDETEELGRPSRGPERGSRDGCSPWERKTMTGTASAYWEWAITCTNHNIGKMSFELSSNHVAFV